MSKNKKNAKQIRQETQAQEKRRRQIRIIGITALVLVSAAVLIIWRNAGRVTAEQAAVLAPPNIVGTADAAVQIIEYGDFGCHSCRAWHNSGVKEQLLANYGDQISLEFRHFPVITAQSAKAAEAGQCAAEQGKFWEYHDYIYEQTPEGALSITDLKSYAAAIGLDQGQFDSCLDSGRFEDAVVADMREAQKAGARGTPTFVINGNQVFPSYNAMVEAIEAEIQ